MMTFHSLDPDSVPMSLLLIADPSETTVRAYLRCARCVAGDDKCTTVGIFVHNTIGDGALELFTIAVSPDMQGQGVGSALLRHVIDRCRSEGVRRIELGTGTFGYQ